MSQQNGHNSNATRLHTGAGVTHALSHSSRSSGGSNTMNHSSTSQPTSWNHSAATVGSNQDGAGLAIHQHAAPGTPTGKDYETKVTAPPSPQSSSQSGGTTLKEHDLLGLSEVSSSSTVEKGFHDERHQPIELNLNLNLGATELRLGPQDGRKMAEGGFQFHRSASAMEQGIAPASETSNFLGGMNGGSNPDQGGLVSERRVSNADQIVGGPEQAMDRGFRYGSLSGERGPPASSHTARAEASEGTACRPLIDSESLQKWHGGDRTVATEGLRLGMSLLQPKRTLDVDDVSDKNSFLKPVDRSFRERPQESTQQDPSSFQERSWQERNQQNSVQEDASLVDKDRAATQEQTAETPEQGVSKAEGFHSEKRNLPEGMTLASLQPPEPRFSQDMSAPERSPRHEEYSQQQLWQSQTMTRSVEGPRQATAPDYHNALQDENFRNGYAGPLSGFPGSRAVQQSPAKPPGVAGAKRPYDTIGPVADGRNFSDIRNGQSAVVPNNSSVPAANASSSEADIKSKGQPSVYQQWGSKAPPPWQMLQHSGGSFGPFPSQTPSRNPVLPTMNKPPVEVPGAGVDPAQKAWEAHAKSLQEPASTLSQTMPPSESKPGPVQTAAPAVDTASAPRAAAPPAHAVGWPPLRSFRKSTLAANPRPSPVETQPRPPPPPPQAASPASVASQPNSWFVKVYMDGVPIGRKVDLKTNSSYEKLSVALEDMFRGFVNGQQGNPKNARDITLPSDKRRFLHGSDYVLTYEDQDGDLMLVGDVPWTMFIDTVKRLRIMKGSEAIGLGTRAAEKVSKAQSTV